MSKLWNTSCSNIKKIKFNSSLSLLESKALTKNDQLLNVVNVSNLRCYDKNSIIIVKANEHDEDSSHSSPGLRTLFNGL